MLLINACFFFYLVDFRLMMNRLSSFRRKLICCVNVHIYVHFAKVLHDFEVNYIIYVKGDFR